MISIIQKDIILFKKKELLQSFFLSFKTVQTGFIINFPFPLSSQKQARFAPFCTVDIAILLTGGEKKFQIFHLFSSSL